MLLDSRSRGFRNSSVAGGCDGSEGRGVRWRNFGDAEPRQDAVAERLRQLKVCPVHGEGEADQIVSAYEFAEGRYVAIETDEPA